MEYPVLFKKKKNQWQGYTFRRRRRRRYSKLSTCLSQKQEEDIKKKKKKKKGVRWNTKGHFPQPKDSGKKRVLFIESEAKALRVVGETLYCLGMTLQSFFELLMTNEKANLKNEIWTIREKNLRRQIMSKR